MAISWSRRRGSLDPQVVDLMAAWPIRSPAVIPVPGSLVDRHTGRAGGLDRRCADDGAAAEEARAITRAGVPGDVVRVDSPRHRGSDGGRSDSWSLTVGAATPRAVAARRAHCTPATMIERAMINSAPANAPVDASIDHAKSCPRTSRLAKCAELRSGWMAGVDRANGSLARPVNCLRFYYRRIAPGGSVNPAGLAMLGREVSKLEEIRNRRDAPSDEWRQERCHD